MKKNSVNEGYLPDSPKNTLPGQSLEQINNNNINNRPQLRETLRSPDSAFKYGQTRRTSASHPRPCRPPIIPFDTEKFTEIFLQLENLKNLDTEELPKSGEFVIRVMCMGQVYGHFPSGNVNLHTLATYARSEEPNHRRSPDVFLDHDISFCIKFKDLVDNPLVFHLCHAGGILDAEAYASLPPLGFICLDIGRILNYKTGRISEHIEPWIIPEKPQFNSSKLPFLSSGMPPLLQLSIECSGGLPDSNQLLQGNLMSVLCEGLHNLPGIVQQNVSYADNQAEMQMFMTLPHSQTESVLRFPGGKYREAFQTEPTFRKISIDETTQTVDSITNLSQTKVGVFNQDNNVLAAPSSRRSLQLNQTPKEIRHWASVKDLSPETPLEATAMAGDIMLDGAESAGDGETEIFGDGREDFMEFSETGEPRLVWNSIHRKYLSVDAYRSMLGRLSQNAVWPIEISIAVKKKTVPKKKKDALGVSSTSSNDSNDKMIMSELGQQSAALASEYTLIFHGLAFVDLSCLVHPGMKSARFSCRVHPFSTELLQRRTCVTESVLPEPLLLSLVVRKPSEYSKAITSKSKPQGITNPSKVRVSVDGPGPQTSQPDVPKNRGSGIRRSDFPDNKSNKLHEEQSSEPGGGGGAAIERNPFIVFRISMLRSIVPRYKSQEISKVVDEYLPKRELTRRKLVNASSVQQMYKKAILEAAAEISYEFSERYWKDVLQNGYGGGVEQSSSNSASNEAIKKGFLFYLNASGRYLVLREHLRSAISNVVQQKCLNLRPSGFHNHRDFQSYLHDMYVYLVDEMNEILKATTLQETDPLKSNLDRLLQQSNCNPDLELSKINLHNRQIVDLGIFAEESFAQGDFETCHKLHLQRICRDKESSRCWTEFAIMWLARGDDRMAEIAVREALRKDPLHLYALLISGMISVRHGDERGLECLGAALGLFPMAPEVLVIVGIANSVIGNNIAADYFFRKATYTHRIITGQATEDIENLFTLNNAKKPFNMKQFSRDLDTGVPTQRESFKKHVQVDTPPIETPQVNTTKRGNKRSKNRMSLHGKPDVLGNLADKKHEVSLKRSIGADEDPQITSTASKEKGTRRNTVDSNDNISKPEITIELSSTAIVGEIPQQPSSNGPKFSFMETLNDILPQEVELPPLVPSIQSPFDVTQFSEKLERHLLTIDYLEKSSTLPPKFSAGNNKTGKEVKGRARAGSINAGGGGNVYNNVYIPKDEGLATDNQIKEEYDKIINEDKRDSIRSGGSNPQSGGGTSQGTGNTTSNDLLTNSSKSKRNSSNMNKRLSVDAGKEGAATTPNNFDVTSIPIDFKLKEKSQNPRLTDRLGAELIWTANLLINLRLFDFVDGVLAKHLYFYGKRSVQFIYLRALSLYLRQREEEALPLIKEAIEYDNTGHCYYVMGNSHEAIISYEKALRLPHTNENRHLLYLRYGSLVLDQGKSKVAKRVFLHGVSKYPTPYMWLALGSACFQRQEYSQAESAFAEANRLDSTNPIAWGHLALSSMMQEKKALAEQSYKWALRFGLKKGVLLDEIQRLQKEKGFGDPSFPRVPNCVPHDFYLRRMGRMRPFNLYKEGLNQEPPRIGKGRYDDTDSEQMLKKKLGLITREVKAEEIGEWEGEYEEGVEPPSFMQGYPNHATQSTGFKVQSAPADLITTIKQPTTSPASVD